MPLHPESVSAAELAVALARVCDDSFQALSAAERAHRVLMYVACLRAAESMGRVRGARECTYTVEERSRDGELVTHAATWRSDRPGNLFPPGA
jgi:hypothetical protein